MTMIQHQDGEKVQPIFFNIEEKIFFSSFASVGNCSASSAFLDLFVSLITRNQQALSFASLRQILMRIAKSFLPSDSFASR